LWFSKEELVGTIGFVEATIGRADLDIGEFTAT
jgi:hypothetical protein